MFYIIIVHLLYFHVHLLELAKSVSIVRSHAAEWNIDPEKILVAGFSAGAT